MDAPGYRARMTADPEPRGARRAPVRRRRRLVSRRRVTPGAAPGTIQLDAVARPTVLRGVSVSADEHVQTEPRLENGEWRHLPQGRSADWLQVTGLQDVEVLRAIAARVGMPDLVLEDVAHVDQRAKLDETEDGIFVVLRVPSTDRDHDRDHDHGTVQVTMFLGSDLLVSFEESPTPLFDGVHERLARKGRRIRTAGPAYLLYALVDVAVDSYFPVLEALAEELECIEEEVTFAPRDDHLRRLHAIKHDVLRLLRDARPMIDALKRLLRCEDERFDEKVAPFLGDCLDHAQRVVDQVEHLRDAASAAMDLHQSVVGNRMNEVMKLLTLIATIFIPLSFVTSLYGMNFDAEVSPWNMPELRWRYGYPVVVGAMLLAGLALLWWFRRRGYLGSPPPRR